MKDAQLSQLLANLERAKAGAGSRAQLSAPAPVEKKPTRARKPVIVRAAVFCTTCGS